MKRRLLIPVFPAMLLASSAHAVELKPPQGLEYGGKSYQSTSSATIMERGSARLFYRYTNSNETKDQWISMVVVQFSPKLHLKDEAWARDIKAYFDASKPRPYYSIVNIGGNNFARYLNPPSDGQPSESSVMQFFLMAVVGK